LKRSNLFVKLCKQIYLRPKARITPENANETPKRVCLRTTIASIGHNLIINK